jgi:hypothetical protein
MAAAAAVMVAAATAAVVVEAMAAVEAADAAMAASVADAKPRQQRVKIFKKTPEEAQALFLSIDPAARKGRSPAIR